MKPRNFILIVQGEGRGHLTQALTVIGMLTRNGHHISCIIVGTSSKRVIPDFFSRKTNIPIVALPSPNFITDGNNKSINFTATIWNNLFRIGKYLKSISIIRKLISFHQPDFVLNFYEPLFGLYSIFHNPSCRIISIAHQNIYLHEQFQFPPGNRLKRQMIKIYTRIAGINASLLIALSFYPLAASVNNKIVVSPPLLRNDLFNLESRDDGFILIYLLNDGFMQEIREWHESHPNVSIHCFTDSILVRNQPDDILKIDDTLSFHALNDRKFLDMMSRCSGLVCTAGFESVCEALYLHKPILMVPVPGHFEQFCNARDAVKVNAGIYDEYFNLELFLDFLPQYHVQNNSYCVWIKKAESILMNAIESFENDNLPVNPSGRIGERIRKAV